MKIPGTEKEVTQSQVWKTATMAATVIVAWVWIQSQFVEQSDFDVHAMGVQAQQAQTTKALLMQELRWVQAQKRQAEKDNDPAEVSRLKDEIERIKLDIKDLKK